MKNKTSIPNFELPPIGIIGGGRIGANLAQNLSLAGRRVSGLVQRGSEEQAALRSRWSASIPLSGRVTSAFLDASTILLIAVQDDHLTAAVKSLSRKGTALQGKIIAHLSGVHTSEVLLPLKEHGALIASCHPNVAVRNPQPRNGTFNGIYFDMEGDKAALAALKGVVSAIDGKFFMISREQKVAVHLAAVMYSNFFITLAEMAQQSLRSAGVPAEHGWDPFRPLVESAVDNLSGTKPSGALTGPLIRGDVETIRRHLEFMKVSAPALLPAYIQLSESTLGFASLPAPSADKIRALLKRFKPAGKE